MKSGTDVSAEDALKFLENHKDKVIAWGSNFRINKTPSPENPLKGFINYESKVRYETEIIEIIRYNTPTKYPNVNERPENWKNAEWKTFFRFKNFKPIGTISFRKTDGSRVKHPPQNYVEVAD